MADWNNDVQELSESTFLRLVRDVVIPVAMVPFIGIGSWLILDHLALRNDVTINSELLRAQDRRVELLEELATSNASNRFTDADGIRLEQRVLNDINNINNRIDRLEDGLRDAQ